MPHCTKCGTMVDPSAVFCPNCGQSQGVAAPPAGATSGAQSGLSENAAATLSYVLGWLTGLIFFLIDKRPYVRFHAAQSLVVFGVLHIARIVLGLFFGLGWAMTGGAWNWSHLGWGLGITSLLGLLMFVLWIVLMIKAYQGEKFRIPIAADLADSLAGQ